MYLYQVIDPGGRVMMATTDPRCAYPAETERAIKRAGYKVRVRQGPDGGPTEKA